MTSCGDQRAACRNWVSFSIMWVSGINFRQVARLGGKCLYLLSCLMALRIFPLGGYEGVGADYIGLTYAGQVSLLSCSP